jgi:hypothetical protein
MMGVVYGQMWNDDLRFIFDHISVDDARKRYRDGPWFGLAVGEGLCTSADEARAAEATGVSLPVPEFCLELEARARDVRALFYDERNSVTILHDWGVVGDRLFLESVVRYYYPDQPRFFVQNESLKIWSMSFKPDGTAKENTRLPPPPGAFVRTNDFTEHRNVPLGNHYIPIPEFGDWAALGHRDRYLPPGGKA